jgi:geranylgeranyl diphosphate synthase type II
MIENKINHDNLLLVMQDCSLKIDQAIENFLPLNFQSSRLVEAMRYSCFLPGKKMRPFLFKSILEIFDLDFEKFINIACSLEFIHVYSLIHDDLPAMDNDDFRRDKPSNHKKFDEATAILAGDALLTLAFETISSPNLFLNDSQKIKIINKVANYSGYNGMVGGQMIDIESINKKVSLDKIFEIHHLKTAKLFMASIETATIIAKANDFQTNLLLNFAKNLGLAFQIKDDLLDYNIDKNLNKKSINNEKNTLSIVEIIGENKSQKMLLDLKSQAIEDIKKLEKNAKILLDLFNFIIYRNK